LFYDGVRSERELLRMLPERLDYLWFLGFGLDAEIPDHSVLSKARARWGKEVFEGLFVRTVGQCVAAGLVDGSKLYLDGSLVTAHASRESVVKSTPELIAALKAAYQPGRTFAQAFAEFYRRAFAAQGLLILDPQSAPVHRLGAPVLVARVRARDVRVDAGFGFGARRWQAQLTAGPLAEAFAATEAAAG